MATEISDEKHLKAASVLEKIQKFCQENCKPQEIFRASIFRTGLLKLREPSGTINNHAFIFCWIWQTKYSTDKSLHGSLQSVSVAELKRAILNSPKSKEIFPRAVIQIITKQTYSPFNPEESLDLLISEPDGDPVSVSHVCQPEMIAEAQLCKLLRYMRTFDSRTISLLSLVRYWAKVNNITFGENSTNSGVGVAYPAALDWMVISWMSTQGLVPRPRDILQREHSLIEIVFQNHKVDLGFCLDSKYADRGCIIT